MLYLQLLPDRAWRDDMKATSSEQYHGQQRSKFVWISLYLEYGDNNESLLNKSRKIPMIIFDISRMIKITIFARNKFS